MASEVAKALRDRRLSAWNEAKGVLEGAENRSLTSEENQKYDAAMTEVDALDSRLKTVLDSEQRSREADAAYDAVAQRPADRAPQGDAKEEELRNFLLTPVGEQGYKREIEVNRVAAGNLNLRTLGSGSAASATSGSNLVPTDFYDQLIAYLIEVSGILQTGPTVLRTAGGETINIPVASAHVTAGTAAQAATLPTADPTFSQKPLGASKFATMVQVSRELIDDNAVDLLGYLAMTAGRAIGNSFGNALINGGSGITGSLLAGASVGATSGPAVTARGEVIGGPTYNSLVDLEYSVIAPYRQSRSAYWLAKDQTVGSLRKLTDTNGRPIWEPSPQPGAPDMLLGKPLVADPFMPAVAASANSVVFGDFSQFFVRLVGGLRFERSDDFAFGSDLVSFRAILRGDGTVVDPNALKKLYGGAS